MGGLEIREKLSGDNPDVTEFRQDLARSHLNIGVQLSRAGKPEKALAAYGRGGKVLDGLTGANPAVTGFGRDLAAATTRSASCWPRSGGLPKVWKPSCRRGRSGRSSSRAIPATPITRASWRGVAVPSASLLSRLGKPAQAVEECRQALLIQEELAAAHPDIPNHRNDVAGSLTTVADVLLEVGRLAEASASYSAPSRSVRPWSMRSPPRWCSVVSSPTARADSGWPASEPETPPVPLPPAGGPPLCTGNYQRPRSRIGSSWPAVMRCGRADSGRSGTGSSEAEAMAEAELATDLLGQAIAAGFRDLEVMRSEPGLDPIRTRPVFRLLIMDMKFPADPFDAAR